MATDDGVWLLTHGRITLLELSEHSGLAEAELRELVEYGALNPEDAAHSMFSASCLTPVRKAARLREALELETPAMALALCLLQRIEGLEGELRELASQVPRRGRQ